MPPRPFRESPERRDQRIRKHVAQAQEYWAKGAETPARAGYMPSRRKRLGNCRPTHQGRGNAEGMEPLRPRGYSGVHHRSSRGKPWQAKGHIPRNAGGGKPARAVLRSVYDPSKGGSSPRNSGTPAGNPVGIAPQRIHWRRAIPRSDSSLRRRRGKPANRPLLRIQKAKGCRYTQCWWFSDTAVSCEQKLWLHDLAGADKNSSLLSHYIAEFLSAGLAAGILRLFVTQKPLAEHLLHWQ